MNVLAIDPGSTESAYTLVDETQRPLEFGKLPNDDLLAELRTGEVGIADLGADRVAIEMVASYGMAVGADVFETCVWAGRFAEAVAHRTGREPMLVKRKPVKLHHCMSAKANDTNIKQALVDRFASGVRNHGKGTKADPGWFYGFHRDIWQAYALAVYVADTASAQVVVS